MLVWGYLGVSRGRDGGCCPEEGCWVNLTGRAGLISQRSDFAAHADSKSISDPDTRPFPP
ncbi:hypothetical protein AMATHDRAFT_69591 [Amanita thiersii Skay4041]|uniref:Uncharacterized protein n=1 Tax=Amanita thiersii Skay4041 TaxID=703135 RepID=A0A2A9NFW0_9AGAR|nr:hypothetical protein AMATHDRAFT_69591 [Amanita thiersii Skay4041]